MSMAWMRMPGQSWPSAAAMFMVMWLVMMAAMMGCSVLPVLARYRRTANSAAAAQMAAGYFFVYVVIGAAAYPLGVALAIAAMRLPALSQIIPLLSAVALLIAGAIQWTPWKMAHLLQCRDPLHCCASVGDETRPWRMGVRWGVSCARCCSGIMLTLFVLGMMNPWVILILTVVITLERLLPRPEPVAQLSGVAAIVSGTKILGALWFHR
jgi:predicted metal-binding membrane protein